MKFIKKSILNRIISSQNDFQISHSNNNNIKGSWKKPTQQNNNQNNLNTLKEQYQTIKNQLQQKNIIFTTRQSIYFEILTKCIQQKKEKTKIQKMTAYIPKFAMKKINTINNNLHNNNKISKQTYISILNLFQTFSQTQKYKFIIDLLTKYIQKYQYKQINKNRLNKSSQLSQLQSQISQQLQQNQQNILIQGQLSLNQLKSMSLSYWTKVNIQFQFKKKIIKISGKSNFIIQLSNYLIRISKNIKYCIVLQVWDQSKVSSWMKKIYLTIKKQIFNQVYNKIWNIMINSQVKNIMKMQVNKKQSYQQFNSQQNDKQYSEQNQNQTNYSQKHYQDNINIEKYYIFITYSALKAYFEQKNDFYIKVRTKINFQQYKSFEYNTINHKDIQRQYLNQIKLYKSSTQKSKQINLNLKLSSNKYQQFYQVRGIFSLPAAILKFKFLDALKQRNKYISKWQLLQQMNQQYNFQALSQIFNFVQCKQQIQQQFNKQYEQINDQNLIFKQLMLKQQNKNYLKDQISQILVLKSIKQLSKSHALINFLLVQCYNFKNSKQKSELKITVELNKKLFKKSSKQKSFLSQQIVKILIQNLLKQLILMTYTKDKIYQQTFLNQQQFFTICQQFDNINNEQKQIKQNEDDFNIKNIKSSQNMQEYTEQYSDQNSFQQSNQFKKISNMQQKYQNNKFQYSNINENSIKQQKNNIQLRQFKSSYELQNNVQKFQIQNMIQQLNQQKYLKNKFNLNPTAKPLEPQLVQKDILSQDWRRLQLGGLYCINEKKIKQQKKILQKVLAKLGQNIIKQKNIMNISLPVTIFKKQSQLTSIARSFSYIPLFLQPQCFKNQYNKPSCIQRIKKSLLFLLSTNYAQINFQKPFNPILGQTLQILIDGCPMYLQQISHHPQITYFYFIGRGFKMYGPVEPKVSMGINHCKVTSYGIKKIQFDTITGEINKKDILEIGPNRMVVNGTVIGQRTFNIDSQNFVYDFNQNLLAIVTYGPIKKSLFSNSKQLEDYFRGKIYKMSEEFRSQYIEWRDKYQYNIKKQWIQQQICQFNGIWNQAVYFNGKKQFDFHQQLPYQIVNEKYPLYSDSRYREDLQWLIKDDINQAQIHKDRMEDQQRYDNKLRTQYQKKINIKIYK